MEDHPIPTATSLPVAGARKLLSQLGTDVRHTPPQRLRNDAMAYLMLKTGLREIEISRTTVGDLQPGEPGQGWRLYVHGKRQGDADDYVQVMREVYGRIQAYLTLRPSSLQGSDLLFATTACVDRGGNIVTAPGKRLSTRAIHRIFTEGLLLVGVKKPGIVVHSLRPSTQPLPCLMIRIQRGCRR